MYWFDGFPIKTYFILIFITTSNLCFKLPSNKSTSNCFSIDTPEANTSNLSMKGDNFHTHVLISPILDPVVLFQLNGVTGCEISNGETSEKNNLEKCRIQSHSEHNYQPLLNSLYKNYEIKNSDTESVDENYKINFNPLSNNFPESLEKTPNFNVEEDVKLFLKDNFQRRRMNESAAALKNRTLLADFEQPKRTMNIKNDSLPSDYVNFQSKDDLEMNLFKKNRNLSKYIKKDTDYYSAPFNNLNFRHLSGSYYNGKSNEVRLRQMLQKAFGPDRHNNEHRLSSFNIYPLIKRNSWDKVKDNLKVETNVNLRDQHKLSHSGDDVINLTNENKPKLTNDYNEKNIERELDNNLSSLTSTNISEADGISGTINKTNEKLEKQTLLKQNIQENQMINSNRNTEEYKKDKNENDNSFSNKELPKIKRSNKEEYYDNDFDYAYNAGTNSKDLLYILNDERINRDNFHTEENLEATETFYQYKMLKSNQSKINGYSNNFRINSTKCKLNNNNNDYDAEYFDNKQKYHISKKKVIKNHVKQKRKNLKIHTEESFASTESFVNSTEENKYFSGFQGKKEVKKESLKENNHIKGKVLQNKSNRYYIPEESKKKINKLVSIEKMYSLSTTCSSKGKIDDFLSTVQNIKNWSSVLPTPDIEKECGNDRYLAIVVGSLYATETSGSEKNTLSINKSKCKKIKGKSRDEITHKQSSKSKKKTFKQKKKKKNSHVIEKRMNIVRQHTTFFEREELIGYSTFTVNCQTTQSINKTFQQDIVKEARKIRMKMNKRDRISILKVGSDVNKDFHTCPCPKPCKCVSEKIDSFSKERSKGSLCCPISCKCKTNSFPITK